MTVKGKVQCAAAVTSVSFTVCLLLTCSSPFALIAVDTMVSSQGVAMAASIRGYYKSLPAGRKTVLTNLLQCSMVDITVVFCHYLVISLFTNLLPETTCALLQWFPSLFTSIAGFDPLAFIGFGILDAIVGMRIFARLSPTSYLEMNHERVTKFVVFCILAATSIQCLLKVFIWGHLSNTHVLKYLQVSEAAEDGSSIFLHLNMLLMVTMGCLLFMVEKKYTAVKKALSLPWQFTSKRIYPQNDQMTVEAPSGQPTEQNFDKVVAINISEHADDDELEPVGTGNTDSGLSPVPQNSEGMSHRGRELPTHEQDPNGDNPTVPSTSSSASTIPTPPEKIKVHLVNPGWMTTVVGVALLYIIKFGGEQFFRVRILLIHFALTGYILTSDEILAYMKRKLYQFQVNYLKRI